MEEIKGKQDGRITYTGICFSDSPILTGDIQVERSLVNKNIYRLCGTRISRIMTSSYTSGMFVCICMFCMTIGGLFIIYKQAHKTVKNSNGKLNKLAVISKFSSNHCYYLWHYFILMLIIAGFLYWEIKVVSCLFILKGDGTISFFLLELCVCSFLSIIGVVIFYRFLKDWGKNGIPKIKIIELNFSGIYEDDLYTLQKDDWNEIMTTTTGRINLYLDNTTVNDLDLKRLKKALFLNGLSIVNVPNLTEKSIDTLITCKFLKQLRISPIVTDVTLEKISRIRSLQELDISNNCTFTMNGLFYLKRLTNLYSINLSNCIQITDLELGALSQITSLVHINLSCNDSISLEGIIKLSRLSNLKILTIDKRIIFNKEILSLLKKKLINCKIILHNPK